MTRGTDDKDLVGLLHALACDCANTDGWEDAAQTVQNAADRIEQLSSALAKAIDAFAEIAQTCDDDHPQRKAGKALSALQSLQVGGGE